VRKGGKIGLANWTPDGFIGQLLKIIGKRVPPPAAVKPGDSLGNLAAPEGAVSET
jgi:hypothetical protein